MNIEIPNDLTPAPPVSQMAILTPEEKTDFDCGDYSKRIDATSTQKKGIMPTLSPLPDQMNNTAEFQSPSNEKSNYHIQSKSQIEVTPGIQSIPSQSVLMIDSPVSTIEKAASPTTVQFKEMSFNDRSIDPHQLPVSQSDIKCNLLEATVKTEDVNDYLPATFQG
jgi:hypothetical protein